MKYNKTSGGYIVRFERGERIIEKLTILTETENIAGAFFYGLGGADSARLGIYQVDKNREYEYRWFGGPLEVTNITGNISLLDGKVKVHAHATVSGVDLNASGGHVEEIIVGPTLELFVKTLDTPLNRLPNDEVGLPLLDL